MNEIQYTEIAYQQVKKAIISIDKDELDDIYAISFWKSNDNDDPRYPVAILGYNTEAQVKEQCPFASNEQEARWNFAFWLQNELVVLGEDDGFTELLKSVSLYYNDEALEQTQKDNNVFAYQNKCDEEIQSIFLHCLFNIVKRLNAENVIKEKFGKELPIIIHELEYYDVPINWTKTVNSESVIADFLKWYNSF